MKYTLTFLTALLLAPLAALHAAESASTDKFPAFSWERVPRYMHIRKDTAFTADEIRYLASFPLVTFEKMTGGKDFGSTEEGTLVAARAVKALNPAAKILYYRNVFVHYGGYAANAALANLPEAFLDGRNGNWPRTPESVRVLLSEYYRYISYLDVQIGRVLEALDASPHSKNTIVVFSADSGAARGSHGLVGKQNLYEFDSLRVPFIMSGPGIPANKITESMCYLFDVLPTLGKICGVPTPNKSDGFDFSATLSDPAKPARRQMLFAYKNVQRAFCDEQWKLIRYPQVDRTQLFNLKNDPYEVTNLAYDPEYAGQVADLMKRLTAEMQQNDDKVPLTVASPQPAEWNPPDMTNDSKKNLKNIKTK